MVTETCGRVVFHSRPGVNNLPTESNFAVERVKNPQCKEGEILVKTLYLSVDPYMRCRMNEDTGTAYLAPWALGEPPAGGGVGKVVQSRSERFGEGDIVESAVWPWQEFVVFSGENPYLNKEESPFLCSKPSLLLGIVGIPGLTSYFGIKEKAHIEPGANQTVVISGAAGACGIAAGQIAKLRGCGAVIGICGTDEKCRFLTEEMGFDDAINYKTTKNISEQIKLKCPTGVDVYFDNVGGEVSKEVIRCMNKDSHVVLCGQISVYNKDVPYPPPIPQDLQDILKDKNITRDRYLVLNYMEKFPDGKKQLEAWVREGRLKNRETVAEGLENTGKAFVAMMSGGNIGKQLVKVAEVTP
ncbi:prostaglandin reductase 2-like [Oculina patagonica]